jgi:hypothetical protein
MADALLKLPDDSANTGKQLDTESLVVGAQTVHRERLQMAGAAAAEIAAIKNAAPAANAYGVVTRIPEPATAALTQPAQNAASAVVLAANANRRGFVIENAPQDDIADLFLAFAATATTSAYTKRLRPGEGWDRRGGYTGVISGIWSDAGSGSAKVTEES